MTPLYRSLKPHQRAIVKAAMRVNGLAILAAQRTGKTWVTGAIIEKRNLEDVLIVCPKTNIESTWLKFIAEKLPQYRVFRDLKSYVEHQKAFKKTWGHRALCILLINWEALTPILSKVLRLPLGLVVFDEAQRMKNRSSASSRAASRLSKVPYRLALTGTPMDQDPRDLWAIMRFVEPEVFGKNWKDFDRDYLEQPNIDPRNTRNPETRKRLILKLMIAKRKAPIRKDMLKTFAREISPYVIRVSAEDAGLSTARSIHKACEMKGSQLRLYRKLEKTMVVKVQGTTVVTPLKITQMAKLQQITGGFLIDEDGETHVLRNAKLELLERLVTRYAEDEPFVVFCKYRYELSAVEDMLRSMGFRSIAKLWGKVKDTKTKKHRTELLMDWQRGKYDVMIAQQKTGGVGVDLFHARTAFVFSMGHSWIDHSQMKARLDAMSEDVAARFFFLYCRDTIDQDIVKAVGTKESVSLAFYRRLRR